MGQIAVVVMGPESHGTGVEMPDDVMVKHLVRMIVDALGYGEGCSLYNRTQHFWYEATDTLASRNTMAGDNLRLMER